MILFGLVIIKYTIPKGKSYRLTSELGGIFTPSPNYKTIKEIDITNGGITKTYPNKLFDTLFKKESAGEYLFKVR